MRAIQLFHMKQITAIAITLALLFTANTTFAGVILDQRGDDNIYQNVYPPNSATAAQNVWSTLASQTIASFSIVSDFTGTMKLAVNGSGSCSYGTSLVDLITFNVVTGVNNIYFPYTFNSSLTDCTQFFYQASVVDGGILYGTDNATSPGTSGRPQIVWFDDYPGTGSDLDFSDLTRIVSVSSPLNESVQTTSVTFSGTYYLNNDYTGSSTGSFVNINITPQGQYSTTTYKTLRIPLTVENGNAIFSTTTTLENNMRYSWNTQIYCSRTYDWFTTCDQSTGLWHTGFYQFTTGQFDPTYGQNFDLSSCNVLSGFDPEDCIYNLIFPNNISYPRLFNQMKEVYGRAWPIGYVTRFYEILSSSTPLYITFTAQLPNNLVGVVPPITLDFNGILDNTLNSKASDYGYGSSTETLYETTSYYWDIIIYIAMGLYMLRRIIGSHIIPKIK